MDFRVLMIKKQRLVRPGKRLVSAAVFIIIMFSFINSFAEDLREYQHGIDFVPSTDGNYWLIWSSSGHPPTGASNNGSWTHDIYYSDIDPANPQINPVTIISKYEAQEPASSAMSSDGNIMITMEDGWNVNNSIGQRYGVYDNNLSDVNPYPNMVLDGGHSGHVAAVTNRFVVFYSDDWINGGGVDNLGSGDDVMLKVYSSTGNFERETNISVGNTYRDWWPVVSGSPNHALLLWQRFVNDHEYVDLMYAVYNPADGNMVKANTRIAQQVKYYTYDVQYISSINRFLILGTYHSGGGFSFLVDKNGVKTGQNTDLSEIVREAQPAVKNSDNIGYAVYPSRPNGLAVLELTESNISLNNTISDSYAWSYIGTDGIFTTDNSVYFVTLSKNGCVGKTFDNIIAASINNQGESNLLPRSSRLGQNYPNPFNPVTTIPFHLEHKTVVSLKVYNVCNNVVDTLINEEQPAGSHELMFDGSSLSSGIYYYQLKLASGYTQTRKLILIK